MELFFTLQLYSAVITRKKKKKNTAKTHHSARKVAVRHDRIMSTATAIITHAKSYDLSTMSILSVQVK